MTEYGTQSSIYFLVSYILSRLTFNVFFLALQRHISCLVCQKSIQYLGGEQFLRPFWSGAKSRTIS